MSVLDGFRLALKGLRRRKLQSALTTLGITFGVAAVLTMVALGTGARTAISRHVRTSGTNIVTVETGNYERFASSEVCTSAFSLNTKPSPKTRPGEQPYWWPAPTHRPVLPGQGASTNLRVPDANAIRQIPNVELVTLSVEDNARIVAGERRHFTRLKGVDVNVLQIHGWKLLYGRFFNSNEIEEGAQVVVLGIAVSHFLFGEDTRPIGQQIDVQGRTFSVIGVTDQQRRSTEASSDAIYIPFTTAQSLLNIKHLHRLEISTTSAGVASQVATEVTELLRKRHQLKPNQADDFRVRTQVREALFGKGLAPNLRRSVIGNVPTYENLVIKEMSLTLEQAGRTMSLLLVAIASVALFVGGIGIMNIMLVSTSDRTREIGIRRMVGARERDVLVQFLLQAVMLSVCGGSLGILVGYAAAATLTHAFGWISNIPLLAVLLTFITSLTVGVFFGLYPARLASRIDVVKILHEN